MIIKGWNIVRYDRVEGQCGGFLCYVKNDIPIGDKLFLLPLVCEILGISLPSINLVNVNV